MTFFIIIYKGNNSSEIKEAVKTFPHWAHFAGDNFIIHTDSTALGIKSKLETAITQSVDMLLVVPADMNQIQGWLPRKIWDWIKLRRDQKIL